MEKINFKDIRVGDYICVTDIRCDNNAPKFPSVYLKIDYLERDINDEATEVMSNIWVVFDYKGDFEEIRKEEGSLVTDCLYYKLSEEEWGNKVNKYLILNAL